MTHDIDTQYLGIRADSYFTFRIPTDLMSARATSGVSLE